MKKRLSALFLAFMVLSMVSRITAYAVEPRYAYTTSATSTLTISSGTAYCKSNAKGNGSVTKIVGTQYLEKRIGSGDDDWSTVSGGTWINSTNNNSLTMSNSQSSLGSGTYRLRTVFTVYCGTSYETVEKLSKEVTI